MAKFKIGDEVTTASEGNPYAPHRGRAGKIVGFIDRNLLVITFTDNLGGGVSWTDASGRQWQNCAGFMVDQLVHFSRTPLQQKIYDYIQEELYRDAVH